MRTGVWCALAVAGLGGSLQAQAEPEPFQPYDLRPYRFVNSIAFSPEGDVMYFTLFAREVLEHRGLPVGDAPEVGLFRASLGPDGWSEPEVLAIVGPYDSYEPTISADGSRMVFNSRRPYPDGRMPERNDLWMSEREGDEWGEPRRIEALTTFELEESYAALSNGSLVYLREQPNPEGASPYDLYESVITDGEFGPPRRHPVSTDRWGEGDPWLSPDGDVLIFTRWDDEVGWAETVDLYVSIRRRGAWSDPVPLTELNSDGADLAPAASPDGEWLYYRSDGRFLRTRLATLISRYR